MLHHPHAVYRPLDLTLTISAGCVVSVCVRACVEVYMWFGWSDGFPALQTLFPLSLGKSFQNLNRVFEPVGYVDDFV